MTAAPEAERIFDGETLRATLLPHPDPGPRPAPLIVTFDFRQPGKSDFGAPTASAGFRKAGFSQLSIRTRANDWFVNPETPALEARLRSLAHDVGPVHMLGWSMGGYGAFRFAAAMGASRIVAVSPQVSLDPATVPFEWRYPVEARGFDPRLGRIPPPPGRGPSGMILVDPFIAADLAHARALGALFPRVRLLRLAGGGHPASRLLRAAGKAWHIQRAAMQPDADANTDVLPTLRSHKAARRGSADYLGRLARAAGPGHPRVAAWAEAGARDLATPT